MNKYNGPGSLCYIPKIMEIGPLVPKKILRLLPYTCTARKPSGHVTLYKYVFISLYLKAYIQNLVKKSQAVSEKNKF